MGWLAQLFRRSSGCSECPLAAMQEAGIRDLIAALSSARDREAALLIQRHELLEALKECAAFFQKQGNDHKAYGTINDELAAHKFQRWDAFCQGAIAKATGAA